GRCCSPTTRWRGVTARATARRCAPRAWRPRPRSSACARWRPAGSSACPRAASDAPGHAGPARIQTVIRLADRTSREAAALARHPRAPAALPRPRRAVVLPPPGPVEHPGPPLPLSVDWLGAEEIARRLAPHLGRGGYRPLLAPSIPYGVSTLAVGWSGTVSLS